MPNTLAEQVLDQITVSNAKGLADMNQVPMGLSVQNAVSAQQRVSDAANAVHENVLNASQQVAQLAAQQALQIAQNGAMLSQAMTGRVARMILDASAEQAVAFAKEIGADVSSKLADFGGALASLQEQAKIAQTTPPQTGTGGAFGSDSGNALLQQLANIQALLNNLASNQGGGTR